MNATIYERGNLSVVAPVRGHDGKPRAVIVQRADGSVMSLVQTFTADQIDGLAAAVLKARELLRADPAEEADG